MHAPFTPKFRAEWRSFADLEAFTEQWCSLAARAVEPNVFYEPAFARNAAPVFGRDVGAVLVWSTVGRLMGLFPARHDGMSGTMIGWTHPYAPLGVPLVDREQAEDVIAAWLDHLAHDAAAPARLMLRFVPEQGPFALALDAVLKRRGQPSAAFGRHQRAMLDPGAQRHGYLDRSMSAGRRKELRRQRRRLDDIAPLSFVTATTPDEVAAALKDFLVIEASGWKGIAGTAAVNEPSVRGFVETAVMTLAAEGKARVDRILLNGRAIAAAVTLISNNSAWWWKIAYSEGHARSSPGVQLAIDLTAALLTEPKLARVDSCAIADHPMIDHVWHERLTLNDRLIAVKRSAVPFRIACAVEALRRRAIAAAKAMRDGMRNRKPGAKSGLRPKQAADHLARGGHGQLFDKSDLTRIFMRGEPRPYERLDVGCKRV